MAGHHPLRAPRRLPRRFRARVFDGRRLVDLPPRPSAGEAGAGAQRAPGAGGPGQRAWIESAARFRSQIPLEYAYGAWGALPAPTGDLQARLLQPYTGTTWDELAGFAVHRLRALPHMERRLGPKSRFAGKRPLPLLDLAGASLAPPGLPRALQDFLLIEHHARLQELLLAYAQPVERRVQTGRAMLLECLEFESLPGARPARAGASSSSPRPRPPPRGASPALRGGRLGGGQPPPRQPANRRAGLRPGAPPNPPTSCTGAWPRWSPSPRGGGRPPDGDAAGAARDTARLPGPQAPLLRRPGLRLHPPRRDAMHSGSRYTVDEMADDLNGDKLLAACRAAANPGLLPNPLLQWITRAQPEAQPGSRRAHGPGRSRRGKRPRARVRHGIPLQTIDAVERAAGAPGPTPRQREAIAGRRAQAGGRVQAGAPVQAGWPVQAGRRCS